MGIDGRAWFGNVRDGRVTAQSILRYDGPVAAIVSRRAGHTT